MTTFTISPLARRSGLPATTLRHDERMGAPPPSYRHGGVSEA